MSLCYYLVDEIHQNVVSNAHSVILLLFSLQRAKGIFFNGDLQDNHGVEGQGYFNLRRSFMFGGERLWGP